MKVASRIFASRSADKAPLAPVVPGTQFIAGVYVSCKVVETGYEVVRTVYTIVSSQKPGASYTNHYCFDGAFNYATATLGLTKATARPPTESHQCLGNRETQRHIRRPATLPAVDNVGHVCCCSQSNSSMPTAPAPPDTGQIVPACLIYDLYSNV
ncbi:hypothetical protein M404DRAFT_408060 [Pisolithus tinctorius Marx 270]|uniref:Uncharacterized protein n=1 Tax=Pisolithus tinctorius Marx 270 TaxID=870435 RepID=A0A0C3PG88_PISTI|nr:hypothetical protein M404DRAFT_408060 [Pisolithus tinctorius Marx 270]